MRRLTIALVLAACNAIAQEAQATCAKGLIADLASGSDVILNLQANEIDIWGAEQNRIRVSCDFRERAAQAPQVKLELKPAGKGYAVTVEGGRSRDLHLRIEVPKNTNLVMRARSGDVRIDSVIGNKDVALKSGDLTIAVGNPADYSHADASVRMGDLNAFAFGPARDRWNRHFEKDNPAGKYRLHAHVGFGSLVLQ